MHHEEPIDDIQRVVQGVVPGTVPRSPVLDDSTNNVTASDALADG